LKKRAILDINALNIEDAPLSIIKNKNKSFELAKRNYTTKEGRHEKQNSLKLSSGIPFHRGPVLAAPQTPIIPDESSTFITENVLKQHSVSVPKKDLLFKVYQVRQKERK
jgi:hypothetical protein